MNKEIKEIEFSFEDDSSVIVPIECINNFKIKTIKQIEEDTNRINNIITDLHCEIMINNLTTWGTVWKGNDQLAIERLIESSDITYITIKYKDNLSTEYIIRWFGDDDPWFWENENRWQYNHIGNGLEIDIIPN